MKWAHKGVSQKREMPFLLQRSSGEGAGAYPGETRKAAREEKMTDEKDAKEISEKLTGKVAERPAETDRELE